MGPIEAKLLEYGALDGPDAHAVVGLVLGAFGELSTSCYSLCTSDRKSTRLNSSHTVISYAVFCLEKARACSGLIFQKLKSLAAATRAMDVHKL